MLHPQQMTMLSHSKLLLRPMEISMFEPQLWVFALKQKTFCLFLLTRNCFLSREKQGWKEKVLISSCERQKELPRCWPSCVMTLNLSINVYTSSLLWNGFQPLTMSRIYIWLMNKWEQCCAEWRPSLGQSVLCRVSTVGIVKWVFGHSVVSLSTLR